MKTDEIKLRVGNYADSIISQVFTNDTVFGKLKYATAKYWVRQNLWRLDGLLSNFVDKDGDIDIGEAVEFYSGEIFDASGNYTINLQSFSNNPTLSQFLPDKTVIFTKNDLNKMFGLMTNGNRTDNSDNC